MDCTRRGRLDNLPRGWAMSWQETRQQGRGVQGQGGVAGSFLGQSPAQGLGGPEGALLPPSWGSEVKDGTGECLCRTFLLVSMYLLFLKLFLVLNLSPVLLRYNC